MISNTGTEIDNSETLNGSLNLIRDNDQTSSIHTSNIFSNPPVSECQQKCAPSKRDLSSSHLPMNSNNISSEETKKEEGVFTRMFNYIKNNLNPWKIEEEEVIDAHGFKCKRPKTKIPLRKKKDTYEDEIQKAGGESMSYASQHSGFGHIFL